MKRSRVFDIVLKRLYHIVSWVAIFLCLEREGSKPQAGGDFKSPSEKVMKVKNDHRSKFSNLSDWKEKA